MRKTAVLTVIAIVGITSLFIIVIQKREGTKTANPTLSKQVAAVTNQYQKGTINREEANKQFCTLTARSKEEQQKAIESIREYANNSNLAVEYKCNNFSPNNPNVKPTEETYHAEDTYYFIDVATNQVLRTQQN